MTCFKDYNFTEKSDNYGSNCKLTAKNIFVSYNHTSGISLTHRKPRNIFFSILACTKYLVNVNKIDWKSIVFFCLNK